MNVQIIEIVGRSAQGITRPFLCRGEDGLFYYVKGNGAGRRALINEWIAGQLGMRLGLPIPEFRLASIPEALVRLSARDDVYELGAGTGFGSQVIEHADELRYLFIEQLPEQLRAKILLFDWWVANGDRTLTEHGGNPNLLWVHRSQKAFVIDHNLAFDESALEAFWAEHIFARSRATWCANFRSDTEGLMRAALLELDAWWEAMPPEWTEMENGLTLEKVKKLLWRFETDAARFWGLA